MIGLLNQGLLSLLSVSELQASPSGITGYTFSTYSRWLQSVPCGEQNTCSNCHSCSPIHSSGTENLLPQHWWNCWDSRSELGHGATPEASIWANGFTDGLSRPCSRQESAWNNSTQGTRVRTRKSEFSQGMASNSHRGGERILLGVARIIHPTAEQWKCGAGFDWPQLSTFPPAGAGMVRKPWHASGLSFLLSWVEKGGLQDSKGSICFKCLIYGSRIRLSVPGLFSYPFFLTGPKENRAQNEPWLHF